MDKQLSDTLAVLTNTYLKVGYDRMWMRAMIYKGGDIKEGTLVTGSSYGIYGINESFFSNCVNCSMQCQDLYYDFLCAKEVLKANKTGFKKCFIFADYYMAFYDLSKSKETREIVISNVYYPLFKDAHNWATPHIMDLWGMIGEIPENIQKICESLAMEMVLKRSTFFSDIRPWEPIFPNCQWHELSLEEREQLGYERANRHNRQCEHDTSIEENFQILKDYIHLLHMHNILPVVVIVPYTSYYNHYIDEKMKATSLEMLEKIQEEVHFVDFNEYTEYFDDKDFTNSDHLNKNGGAKVSYMLSEMFGK